MKPVRTGALVAAGVVVGRTVRRLVARKPAQRQDVPRQKSRWLAVTVNAPPEKVAAPLSEAVADLDVETRLSAAPGGRGTEIAARPRNSPTGPLRRVAGTDPRQGVRRALREVKSLIEAGEVVRPDEPTTGRRTPGGALVRLLTRRAGGEGRL
jgi:hypothetical protein